ncbi:MAG: hypothetical protein LBG99_03895 [Propionibacteriaceae bacterium]|jgi:hypothetical protein|nr:hypothetical protein [Propionibacteriaceae bacterium]
MILVRIAVPVIEVPVGIVGGVMDVPARIVDSIVVLVRIVAMVDSVGTAVHMRTVAMMDSVGTAVHVKTVAMMDSVRIAAHVKTVVVMDSARIVHMGIAVHVRIVAQARTVDSAGISTTLVIETPPRVGIFVMAVVIVDHARTEAFMTTAVIGLAKIVRAGSGRIDLLAMGSVQISGQDDPLVVTPKVSKTDPVVTGRVPRI